MPEGKSCKQRQSPKSSGKKKKKARKGKKAAAATTPGDTEKCHAVSLPPETLPVSLLPPESLDQPRGQLSKLRAIRKKDGGGLTGNAQKSKKHPKDSLPLLTATDKTSGVPAQGYVAELSAQASESLRWQGVLENPQAEEKRLELYRANRRQRYISHREALLKETQYALKQTFPIESREKKALTRSDQQEQRVN